MSIQRGVTHNIGGLLPELCAAEEQHIPYPVGERPLSYSKVHIAIHDYSALAQ